MGGIGLGDGDGDERQGPRCARDEMRECTRDQESVGGPAERESSQRPGGMLCGKFKFARLGEESRGKGYVGDMDQTRMDWMETRRGTGERETGNGGRVTERARNAKTYGNRNGNRHGNRNGPAQPSRQGPTEFKGIGYARLLRSIRLSSLPSSLSHFPLLFPFGASLDLDLDLDVEQTPLSPPLVKCEEVYRPCRPNLPSPPCRGNAGGRWAAFDFASTTSMTCAKKSSTTHLSRVGAVGPPWWSLPGREVDALYLMPYPPA